MRITSKGQITIPQQVREELNLHAGDEIDVVVDGDGAKIVRAAGSPCLLYTSDAADE